MNHEKVKCNVCHKEIVEDFTKKIKNSDVCINCFMQMVLQKKTRLNYQVGGDY
jgi:hypothetical protein